MSRKGLAGLEVWSFIVAGKAGSRVGVGRAP